MSAQRLRLAAKTLRDRARARQLVGELWKPARTIEEVPPFDLELSAVEFDLMWQPAVALVLADWLDVWAFGFGEGETMNESIADDHALALADAILGDAS